jgi:Fe(II)/alpha-ketoglutarate-dependent arginine beta-hydroxylase
MRHIIYEKEIKSLSNLILTLHKPEIESQVSTWKSLKMKSSKLPKRLRNDLISLSYEENKNGFIVISGFPILDAELGETPKSWQERPCRDQIKNFELFMLLCASFLGEPFGWATQQDGHIIHEILPMIEYKYEQLGFSSSVFLELHTEDAFHAHRPDFLLLGCLRNEEKIPTIISSISRVELSKIPHVDELFKPQFIIKPDKSHLGITNSKLEEKTASFGAHQRILLKNDTPELVPVLFGHKDKPYVRADDDLLELPEQGLAREALLALREAFQIVSQNVTLAAGDLLIVDNYRALHGRAPFEAKYNGKDRWLKRINLSTNFRNHLGCRVPGSRIVE